MTVECFTLLFSITVKTHKTHSAFHSSFSVETDRGILGLHPESPRHFAYRPTARLANLVAFLPQSHDRSHQVSRRILAPPPVCRNTLIYAHTTLRTFLTCDISLGSLTLPAPEAGDIEELIPH